MPTPDNNVRHTWSHQCCRKNCETPQKLGPLRHHHGSAYRLPCLAARSAQRPSFVTPRLRPFSFLQFRRANPQCRYCTGRTQPQPACCSCSISAPANGEHAREQEANGEHVRQHEGTLARINTETRRDCTRKCATHSPGLGDRAHRGLNSTERLRRRQGATTCHPVLAGAAAAS